MLSVSIIRDIVYIYIYIVDLSNSLHRSCCSVVVLYILLFCTIRFTYIPRLSKIIFVTLVGAYIAFRQIMMTY
jgi:hypothetical protein